MRLFLRLLRWDESNAITTTVKAGRKRRFSKRLLIVVDRSFVFCLSEKERNKTEQPFSSSSLDDDDDGDEMIGASLEGICAFSQRETDDRGEIDPQQ